MGLAGTNIAVFRPATQSSQLRDWGPEFATDGNEFARITPRKPEKTNNGNGLYYYSCMHTQGNTNPWLVVDLGQPEEIQKVWRHYSNYVHDILKIPVVN